MIRIYRCATFVATNLSPYSTYTRESKKRGFQSLRMHAPHIMRAAAAEKRGTDPAHRMYLVPGTEGLAFCFAWLALESYTLRTHQSSANQ